MSLCRESKQKAENQAENQAEEFATDLHGISRK
jgi:hypothetical protein